MFVAATLTSSAGSGAVHIRNMSNDGALIEAAVLPPAGSLVTLYRGSLQVAGRIVWQAERRAGLAFSGAVMVADWMSRNPPVHQSKIDEIVRGIRSGNADAAVRLAQPSVPSGSPFESELRALKDELGQVEDGLCASMQILADHPEIQLLDVARQRIERLLARLEERD